MNTTTAAATPPDDETHAAITAFIAENTPESKNDFPDSPPNKTFKTFKTFKSPRNDPKKTPFAGFEGFEGGYPDENETAFFPLESLPSTARKMAEEMVKSALVPESLAAINLLGILSASIGSGLLIDSGGGRITSANLYLLGIAESGTGKGRAFTMAAQPFQEIEAEEIRHWIDWVLPGIKKDLRIIAHDIAPFAARWGENAWRLSLVLHAAKYGRNAGTLTLEESTAIDAVQIVRWFTDEQLAILAPERSNRHRTRLLKLQEILNDHGRECSVRILKNSHGFKQEEIETLCKAFPNRIEIATKSTGGRPSQIVKLKP